MVQFFGFPGLCLGPVCLGFYWLSTGKSMSNKTNGVASTAGFAEASSRTGRRGKAPGEVLLAALHIRGETFSATRHIAEPKLQANSTADQLQRGPIPTAWEAHLFPTKKRKESLQEKSRRHRGDALGFQSPAPPPSCRPRRRSPATRRLPRLLLPSVVLSVSRRPHRPSSSPAAPLPQHIPSSPAVVLTSRPHRPSSSPAVLLSCRPPRPPSSSPAVLLTGG
jgi:hypothetical protein